MNVRVKVRSDLTTRIARAVFAGAAYHEVAAEFGVTVREVQKAVEQAQHALARLSARQMTSAEPIRRVLNVKPGPLAAPAVIWEPKSPVARELGIKAIRRRDRGPSMPYVSMLYEDEVAGSA